MNFSKLKKILFRLYKSYVKEHLPKILLALALSFGVAAGTAAIAWLLDPAVKKIFIEQDTSMLLLIPIAIIIAFSTKGLSLYFARTILVRVGQEICRTLQVQMADRYKIIGSIEMLFVKEDHPIIIPQLNVKPKKS